MSFPDMGRATNLFSRASYSRLKYYWRDLIDKESDVDFKNGASFSTVMQDIPLTIISELFFLMPLKRLKWL